MTDTSGDLFSSSNADTNTNTDHINDDTQNNGDDIEQAIQGMIGDGKKYKTEKDALKALVHGQRHIERIERENVEMRGSLKERIALQELLAQIKEEVATKKTQTNQDEHGTMTTQTDNGNSNRNGTGNDPKHKTDLDIDTLVANKINENETRRAAEANRAKVRDALMKQYGVNYASTVKAEAAQLGLTPEKLNELAGTSPDAFFRLLNIKTGQADVSSIVPGRSTAGSKPSQGGSVKNYRYFEQIRKSSPAQYYSPAVQREMLSLAHQLGDDFYK